MKRLFIICLILSLNVNLFTQSHKSYEPHQGKITGICALPSKSELDFSYITCAEDGTMIKWTNGADGEHYQISDLPVKFCAISPDGKYLAVYETNTSINRISIWNLKTYTREFQKKYNDTITAINFSAKGNYLLVGTSSMDGVEIINSKSFAVIPNKFKANSSISSLLYTSNTEKTAVFYNAAGNLSYFNLQNGELKTKFNIQPNMTQTILYNEAKYLAGIHNNELVIISPVKGRTLKTFPAYNCVIASTDIEKDLYYLTSDGSSTYTLNVINSTETSISEPVVLKRFKIPKTRISYAIKQYDSLFIGCEDGNVYTVKIEESESIDTALLVSASQFKTITDVAADENSFLFITKNEIFKSNFEEQTVEKIIDTTGHTNLISYTDNNIIVYSKGTKKDVSLINTVTGETKLLFYPKNNIQSLKLCLAKDNYYLVEIEKNTIVNIYDFKQQKYRELYTGAGIQDAVITNDNNLYVAKSAATNPKSALVCVNLRTRETVPVQIQSDICFGLSTDGNRIFGISLIEEEKNNNTYVFSFEIETKTMTNLLKFNEEDTEAFTYYNNDTLYTNIGKTKIFCYNIKKKKKYSIDRSSCIPVALIQNKDKVVVLNSNGSVSWTENEKTSLNCDWYISNENLVVSY
ncbi:MAG: hypothetical protein IKX23_04165 [Treponema sp.]|nr:hypothetical protein [Treponema sp.]